MKTFRLSSFRKRGLGIIFFVSYFARICLTEQNNGFDKFGYLSYVPFHMLMCVFMISGFFIIYVIEKHYDEMIGFWLKDRSQVSSQDFVNEIKYSVLAMFYGLPGVLFLYICILFKLNYPEIANKFLWFFEF